MNLIAEEVIKGDRLDTTDVFQWKRVFLNLPGSKRYDPGKSWIAKLRADGTLASNFVQFV